MNNIYLLEKYLTKLFTLKTKKARQKLIKNAVENLNYEDTSLFVYLASTI